MSTQQVQQLMTSTLSSLSPTINTPPDSDEIEISLLGAGYGECVIVHTGAGEWTIVDSCRFKGSKTPGALQYLESIGVNFGNAVKLVVATHWDDDHIRGLGEIVEKCSEAKFVMSAALYDKKFARLVIDSPLSKLIELGQTASTGVTEFNRIWKHLKAREKHIKYAQQDTTLWKSQSQADTEIISLSPHSSVFEQAIESIVKKVEQLNGKPVGRIPTPTPNFTSVVLWLKIGQERLLLGADLEENSAYKGWSLLLSDRTSIDRKAKIYKVAHHGSHTGEHDGIWTDLLENDPYCLIAPWMRGGKALPLPSDVERISTKSNNIFVSHNPETNKRFKSRESHTRRVLDSISARPVLRSFAMIRLRKRMHEDSWRSEIFGSAYQPLSHLLVN